MAQQILWLGRRLYLLGFLHQNGAKIPCFVTRFRGESEEKKEQQTLGAKENAKIPRLNPLPLLEKLLVSLHSHTARQLAGPCFLKELRHNGTTGVH